MRAISKVQTKKLALPAGGFAEISYRTAYESPTGEYTINVYLVKNDKRSTLLGSTTVNVKEFLPDRMKIETRLSKTSAHGWVDPKEMRASIALANLYGTPASDRRVKSHVELSPAGFSFPEFRDYSFYDPLLDEKKERQHESVDLGEQKTDADGRAEMDLQLDRFADATYAMQFFAEAFEGEGGRSITGQASALVSALPYVVGYKADGDLNYINANTPRAVDLLAVDPQLNRIAVQSVTLDVVAQEYVSVVTKKGKWQLRLRIGLERARREIREDRDRRGRIALPTSDGRAGRLRDRAPRRWRPEAEQDSLLRRRTRDGEAFAGQKLRAASEARAREIQFRRRDRDQHHRAVRGQRPDHDRARQSLCAALVQNGRRQHRAADQGAGWFRRQRLHQRRVDSRARFEGNFRQSAQLRRGAVHREHREAAAEGRSANGRDRKTGRAVSHQLQNRPAVEDRRLRRGSRHPASERLQAARSARLFSSANARSGSRPRKSST